MGRRQGVGGEGAFGTSILHVLALEQTRSRRRYASTATVNAPAPPAATALPDASFTWPATMEMR
jgi:hypothetical protein